MKHGGKVPLELNTSIQRIKTEGDVWEDGPWGEFQKGMSEHPGMYMVKKEDPNVRRTVLNSVVGTLDLSIRQFLQGETFPGEFTSLGVLANVQFDTHRYAYIANLCVSKFARRQGIASNMLNLASDVALSSGMKQLFVHVNGDNRPAQDLYKKTGFEIVEAASSPLSKDQRVLMCIEF